jgi:hypothetical protein
MMVLFLCNEVAQPAEFLLGSLVEHAPSLLSCQGGVW